LAIKINYKLSEAGFKLLLLKILTTLSLKEDKAFEFELLFGRPLLPSRPLLAIKIQKVKSKTKDPIIRKKSSCILTLSGFFLKL
jgi:hypothetical protein